MTKHGRFLIYCEIALSLSCVSLAFKGNSSQSLSSSVSQCFPVLSSVLLNSINKLIRMEMIQIIYQCNELILQLPGPCFLITMDLSSLVSSLCARLFLLPPQKCLRMWLRVAVCSQHVEMSIHCQCNCYLGIQFCLTLQILLLKRIYLA